MELGPAWGLSASWAVSRNPIKSLQLVSDRCPWERLPEVAPKVFLQVWLLLLHGEPQDVGAGVSYLGVFWDKPTLRRMSVTASLHSFLCCSCSSLAFVRSLISMSNIVNGAMLDVEDCGCPTCGTILIHYPPSPIDPSSWLRGSGRRGGVSGRRWWRWW